MGAFNSAKPGNPGWHGSASSPINSDNIYQSDTPSEDSMAWFSSSTSPMDLHTAVICAGVFVISALVVYLISVFGMRERTYEEAIEEQRRRNQVTVQHSKTDKNKKEKKFKKWGKKSKEKVDEDKQPSRNDGEKISEDGETKLEAEVNSVINQADTKVSSSKKKSRQKKSSNQGKTEETIQQHSSSEETDEPASVSSSVGNSVQTADQEKQITAFEMAFKSNEEFKRQTSESSVDLPEEKAEVDSFKSNKKSPMKKNKKHKFDNFDLLSLGPDGLEMNENKLLNIIKMTTLSEEEVQHIIDVLSNKVKGNADKKKNEVSTLKKLIQEKDEALRNEQKLCQTASEKINDLIQELNDKKAQSTAAEKSLRDALNQEQQEIKALHSMMQRKREQYTAELSGMQSKMQQMKNKMKEEHSIALQRLQEENNQLQSLNRMESEKQQRSSLEISRLQREIEQLRSSRGKFETHQAAMQQSQEDLHHQIQQLEKHMEQLMSSHQEEEYSYKQRINEMSNKIQQTENARSSLVQELQIVQSLCNSVESDNSSLTQRLDEAKHQLNSSEQDMMKLQNRLEESNRQQREMANCLEKMRSEVVDLSNAKHEHLKLIQSLKQENESLASQVSQNIERMAADGADANHQNGESSEKTISLEQHESIVKEKEVATHKLVQELEQNKREMKSLSNDLEVQKKINKELSDEKNKVVKDANVVEKKLQEVMQTAEKQVKEAHKKADNSSLEMQNILQEKIKEAETKLQDDYTKELQIVRHEAEKTKKEADERIFKSETQANLRLEEFQESLYQRLNQINFETEEKIKEAVQEKEILENELEDFAVSVRNFLFHVFPSINIPKTIGSNFCFSEYETEVKTYLEKLQNNAKHDSKDMENILKKLEETAAEKLKCESQILSYQNVLAETENILKKLQNNVENEEIKWRKELQHKNECLKEIQDENDKLKQSNETLKANMEQLQGLKETLYEIEDLRVKLQKEELEKKALQAKLGVHVQISENSSVPETGIPLNDLSDVNSNILPSKSEKKKRQRKRGGAGKK